MGWIIGFMVVGFGLCALWQYSITSRQRRAEEAAEAARRARDEEARQARAARLERQRIAKQREEAAKEQEKAEREAEKRRKAAEAKVKREAREAARLEKEAAQEAKRAAKMEAARQLAELRERELVAARELARIHKEEAQRREAISDPAPVREQEPEAVTLEAFAAAHAAAQDGPKPFKGQVVAFTGKLSKSGLTRREAAAKVREAGGLGCEKGFPISTTILVVGDNPGMGKLDEADERLGGKLRKVTEAQFLAMFAA